MDISYGENKRRVMMISTKIRRRKVKEEEGNKVQMIHPKINSFKLRFQQKVHK